MLSEKADTKVFVLCGFIYMKFSDRKNIVLIGALNQCWSRQEATEVAGIDGGH